VKVKTLTFVAQKHAVATSIVKRLDVAPDPHELAMDPWPNTLTIANALSADSRPLLDWSGRDRSSA
jgi:hypothetical protein